MSVIPFRKPVSQSDEADYRVTTEALFRSIYDIEDPAVRREWLGRLYDVGESLGDNKRAWVDHVDQWFRMERARRELLAFQQHLHPRLRLATDDDGPAGNIADLEFIGA